MKIFLLILSMNFPLFISSKQLKVIKQDEKSALAMGTMVPRLGCYYSIPVGRDGENYIIWWLY